MQKWFMQAMFVISLATVLAAPAAANGPGAGREEVVEEMAREIFTWGASVDAVLKNLGVVETVLRGGRLEDRCPVEDCGTPAEQTALVNELDGIFRHSLAAVATKEEIAAMTSDQIRSMVLRLMAQGAAEEIYSIVLQALESDGVDGKSLPPFNLYNMLKGAARESGESFGAYLVYQIDMQELRAWRTPEFTNWISLFEDWQLRATTQPN